MKGPTMSKLTEKEKRDREVEMRGWTPAVDWKVRALTAESALQVAREDLEAARAEYASCRASADQQADELEHTAASLQVARDALRERDDALRMIETVLRRLLRQSKVAGPYVVMNALKDQGIDPYASVRTPFGPGGIPRMKSQKVMIVQVPSEANAERLICTRISDANAKGWTITQMMDHNGFLVLLLEAEVPPGPCREQWAADLGESSPTVDGLDQETNRAERAESELAVARDALRELEAAVQAHGVWDRSVRLAIAASAARRLLAPE